MKTKIENETPTKIENRDSLKTEKPLHKDIFFWAIRWL